MPDIIHNNSIKSETYSYKIKDKNNFYVAIN